MSKNNFKEVEDFTRNWMNVNMMNIIKEWAEVSDYDVDFITGIMLYSIFKEIKENAIEGFKVDMQDDKQKAGIYQAISETMSTEFDIEELVRIDVAEFVYDECHNIINDCEIIDFCFEHTREEAKAEIANMLYTEITKNDYYQKLKQIKSVEKIESEIIKTINDYVNYLF